MSYAQIVADFMDSKGFHHSGVQQNSNGANYIQFSITGEATNVRFTVIFNEEGHDAAIRAFDFVEHIPDSKYAECLVCCNELNMKFRYVKFYIDNDNSITLEDDAVIDEETAGDEVLRLSFTMMHIADEAYPILMKAIYG